MSEIVAIGHLTEKIERLETAVHQLTVALRTRLEVPAELLRIDAAAKRMGIAPSTLAKLSAKGIFTDNRAGKGQGSTRLFYGDECDCYRHDGEQGVARYRAEMGRD